MDFASRVKEVISGILAQVRVNRVSYASLFFVFNFFLIFVLRGTLLAMRAATDPHDPVSLSFIHILIAALAWGIVLCAFVIFFRSTKIQTQLKNMGAILAAAAFLELMVMAAITADTFLHAPHNRAAEQSLALRRFIASQSKKLPMTINETITLRRLSMNADGVVFSYELKGLVNNGASARYQDAMRTGMKDITCQLYKENPDALEGATVEHEFFAESQRQFSFKFRQSGCLASKGAPRANGGTPDFTEDLMAPSSDNRPVLPPGLHYGSPRDMPRGGVGKKLDSVNPPAAPPAADTPAMARP